MGLFTHILTFLLAAGVIWLLSGILIDATDSVAKRYKKPGFAVAFFVLGFLTSIGEMSVAFNATINDVPQISAGNLLGASLVIFLLIIPLLAIVGNGIPMQQTLRTSNTVLLLFIILLPALVALDGSVSVTEGIIILLFYATLVYRIRKKQPVQKTATEAIEHVQTELLNTRHGTAFDLSKIFIGATLIFLAGHIVVEESTYFAEILGIPLSLVGLLLLSVGTNVPEIVIAVRCILGKHKDIALGDYLGSAAANSVLFALLPIAGGSFGIEASEIYLTCGLFFVGLAFFFFFSRTRELLSRKEGIILLTIYIVFMSVQIMNALRLSDTGAPIESLHRSNDHTESIADY